MSHPSAQDPENELTRLIAAIQQDDRDVITTGVRVGEAVRVMGYQWWVKAIYVLQGRLLCRLLRYEGGLAIGVEVPIRQSAESSIAAAAQALAEVDYRLMKQEIDPEDWDPRAVLDEAIDYTEGELAGSFDHIDDVSPQRAQAMADYTAALRRLLGLEVEHA